MEKKLMLPANYNVMNEEEMTYTSGGDGFTAPFAVGWTIGAVISVANLVRFCKSGGCHSDSESG